MKRMKARVREKKNDLGDSEADKVREGKEPE